MASSPTGGIPEASISVPDAILALRTFPRRFREALTAVPADRLATVSDPATPSVLDRAAWVRDLLTDLARALPRVLDDPGVQLPDLGASEPRPGAAAATDLGEVLDGITTAADAIASRAELTPWEAWDRQFFTDGAEHPASWVVQHATTAGAQQLREIERAAGELDDGDE
ncbi:MAG TPA: hypothetical protein VGN59_14375 [Acidimicrobiia bacterium]|jgi:hypothetical protein